MYGVRGPIWSKFGYPSSTKTLVMSIHLADIKRVISIHSGAPNLNPSILKLKAKPLLSFYYNGFTSKFGYIQFPFPIHSYYNSYIYQIPLYVGSI